MKTINRLKKITKNKSIIEERKNLVHVCNSVANLAEGVPLAGNGNISHSDQSKTLQYFSLSLKCEVSYSGSDAIADKLTEQNGDISALYAELAFARIASMNKIAYAFCFMSRVIRDIDPGL